MPTLEYRVLGPLQVLRDGERIFITAPKQRALLSLLLLHANTAIPQDELIDALWHGDAPPTARAAFQNLIHALRRLLGPEAVDRTSAGYRVYAEAATLDLEWFRRLTADARCAAAVERAAKLREALALWRGPAFADLSGDMPTRPELRRLEDERLSAVEERIDTDLELGQHVAVIPELEELVERHPLRERFWAQLMLALYRTGRQAEALASYRRAHEVLVEEGIEPGVVLRELERAILVQDRALDDPRRALGSTLERAAAILPREPRERVESLFEYGSALIRLGEFRQAALTLEAAGRLAATARERGLEERVRVLLSYLTVFADGGSMLDHLEVAENAAGVFEELRDDAGLAFALSHQAHMLCDTGSADLAFELARRGGELAALAGDLTCAATCRRVAAISAAMGSTPVDEALAVCETAEAALDEDGPPPGWDVAAWLLAQSGRIAEARVLYERELKALRERGIMLRLTVGLARAAHAERAAGDLARAASHLRTAYGLAHAVRADVACVAGELACVLALEGEHREAADLADESRDSLPPADVVAQMYWRRAAALVAACDGRHEEAVLLSDEARALADGTDWLTYRGETLEEAAQIRRLAGDATGEAEALRDALAVYRRKGNVAGAQRVTQTLASQTLVA